MNKDKYGPSVVAYLSFFVETIFWKLRGENLAILRESSNFANG